MTVTWSSNQRGNNMKVVVGLGNPGAKYEQTKHNVGFMCLDFYANKHNETFKFERKFNADVLKMGQLLLVKPQTFMNLSGEAVRKILDYYNIDLDDVLVIYDDLDLPFARIRLREQGGPGGHNGIKSIIQHVNTNDFKRLRVGIDSNPMMEAADYVLSKFSKQELDKIVDVATTTKDIIDLFAEGRSFPLIMNEFNQAQ